MMENMRAAMTRQRYAEANMDAQEHSLVHVFNEYINGGADKCRQWEKEGRTLRDIQEEICAKIDECIGHGTRLKTAEKAKRKVREATDFISLQYKLINSDQYSRGNGTKY